MSIEKLCHDIVSDIVTTMVPISECIPILGIPDIGSSGPDIVSFDPISDPISSISVPISGQYRDIPVSCQTRYCKNRARYRFFFRHRVRYRVNIGTHPLVAKPDIGFFNDIVPDMAPISQKISQYTDIRVDVVSNVYASIAIYRYRVHPISGRFIVAPKS